MEAESSNTTEPEAIEILLVEDNPHDEELTIHALRRSHLSNQIKVVRDGEEALDFIFGRGRYVGGGMDGNRPRVILLDLKLPKVDGLDVLRQIKQSPLTRQIPVVLLTSSQEERDIVAGYDRGANSYIVKPVNFEQFTEAVREIGLYWLLLNRPPTPAAAPSATNTAS